MAKKNTKKLIIPILVGAGAVAVGLVYVLKKKFKVTATASPLSGYVPLEVTFTATVEGGTEPYSYSWSFGDGTISSLQNPVHTYQLEGGYTVSLTVTDAKGKSVTVNITIIVSSPSVSAEVDILSVQ